MKPTREQLIAAANRIADENDGDNTTRYELLNAAREIQNEARHRSDLNEKAGSLVARFELMLDAFAAKGGLGAAQSMCQTLASNKRYTKTRNYEMIGDKRKQIEEMSLTELGILIEGTENALELIIDAMCGTWAEAKKVAVMLRKTRKTRMRVDRRQNYSGRRAGDYV